MALAEHGSAETSFVPARAGTSDLSTSLQALLDPGTFRPLRSAVADGVSAGAGRVDGRAAFVWMQDGASFLRARVPRVTVTLRQAYGGAHIVMNSRDLGADLTLAWEGARIGVMGARQAVALTQRRALAAGADPVDLETAYELDKLDVAASARDGFVDEVIAPADIDAALSSRALCAMVERHLSIDVIRGGADVNDSIRTLAELWYRAAYLAP